jgi:hypothetical protein
MVTSRLVAQFVRRYDRYAATSIRSKMSNDKLC